MGEMIQHTGEPTAKTESTTEKSIEAYQLELITVRRPEWLSISSRIKPPKVKRLYTEGTLG